MGSSKQKRILLVVRWPGGGIRTFIRYNYRSIDKNKWKLDIIAPNTPGLKLLMEDLADINASFIPVENMPNDGSSGAFKFVKNIILALRKNKYDLVHSHGFISGICSSIPSFFLRIPHFMTTHDVIHNSQFSGAIGALKKNIVGKLFGIIDKIQSVSHDSQSILLESFPALGRKKSKCVVIPNGIEVERFLEAEPRDLRGELDLGKDVFLIGFLGRFMSPKGFKYLIEAMEILSKNENLPRKPLVLTFGDGGFIRQDKQMIKSKGLDQYFRFMPFAPNAANTIKGLDVVAMPSIWEACGLLAMEALVAGTPVVGTNCVGLREVLRDTPARIAPKADSISLQRELLEEMHTSSKNDFVDFVSIAKERFDVLKASNEIFKIYDELT